MTIEVASQHGSFLGGTMALIQTICQLVAFLSSGGLHKTVALIKKTWNWMKDVWKAALNVYNDPTTLMTTLRRPFTAPTPSRDPIHCNNASGNAPSTILPFTETPAVTATIPACVCLDHSAYCPHASLPPLIHLLDPEQFTLIKDIHANLETLVNIAEERVKKEKEVNAWVASPPRYGGFR